MSQDDTGKTEAIIKAALPEIEKNKEVVNPEDVHIYFKYEKKFLDVYSETFDFKLACREAQIKPKNVRNNKFLMTEIKKLDELAKLSHRMNVMSGKHVKLMEKFEDHYDELKDMGKDKEAVQMAGNLSRMTDSGMRASGEFRDIDRQSGINVSININMEHNYDDESSSPIDVKAEEITE